VSRNLEDLSELVAIHGDDLPLGETLLVAAREEYPSCNDVYYLRLLDRLAERAIKLSAQQYGDLRVALQRTLFQEEHFRGNGDNYYDPRNSLLNDVIDRRLGIPITLSIIYIEVTRRAGGRAEGVGLPGHFLVQQDVEGEAVLIDPFERGVVLEHSDCARILKGLSGGRQELEPWMLEPTTSRAIVARVLTNLKHAYMLKRDVINAVKTIDRLLVIDPTRMVDLRDRGLLYAELGLSKAAMKDLETYVGHAGKGRDVDAITKMMPSLTEKSRFLN
jgi:regulator of sirC expression with transglutaminase-like and TPR domain